MNEQNLIAVVMPNGSVQLEWAASKAPIGKSRLDLQREIYRQFSSKSDPWMLFLGFSNPGIPLSESLAFFREFAGIFTKKLLQTPELETLYEPIYLPITPEEVDRQLDRCPLMTGADYLNADLLAGMWEALNADFQTAFAAQGGSIADFVKTRLPEAHWVGRVFFHMVENKEGDAPFAFLATYATRVNAEGKSKHLPLKFALKEYEGEKNKLLELLSTVYRAANSSAFISDLLDSGDIFHPLAFSADQAFRFLKDVPVFEQAGILCRIPDWWKKRNAGIGLDIRFGEKRPSLLGMEALLNFNIGLSLGGVSISLSEAKRLLQETEGLAFLKNRWVVVDAKKLAQALNAYEKAKAMLDGGEFRFRDALRLQLNPENLLGDVASKVDIGVSNGKWLASVVEKLQHPAKAASVRPGKGFTGQLRGYQQTGLNWLCFLHTLGFGACLADDMGLGKTIQILAFLSRLKSDAKRGQSTAASLLIIPASLLSNWEKEIERFCPVLDVLFAHPSVTDKKEMAAAAKNKLDDYDLVITTYALANRYEWLQSHLWAYVILDEAQAIKNPGAKQTRAIKKFRAENRIIMTGTPVENRLSDLWSLFDFLNPGLLGTTTEFKRFSKKLSNDQAGYARLRRLVSPYILRRLKTDKRIISDLPDKVEMKTYAALGKKQAVLYGQLVEGLKSAITEKEGMERRGLILSSLIKFKQLCNHPDQYLGTGAYMETESGKFLRLRELCETIYEKREKMLVFTQFKEMTEPLSDFLETIFQRKGLIIHGSVPVARRKKIIDTFQQGENYVPFMILSLKAGGVGLNLTEANHVVHFDRWWNPAVENQATDRAFRIGQKNKVMVHKFVTRGTIEERIDKMIEQKLKLSEDIIGSGGEAWITEMDNEQIVDLFSLSL